MKIVNFGKNFTTTIGGFFQYDYGQIIDVYNTGTDIENLQFEFIQNGQQITVLGDYIPESNSYEVRIPDTFLQNPESILCYIYYEDATKGNTIKIIIIRISAREKYEDIPDPEHQGVVEQILEMIANLQYQIDHFELTPEQMQEIIAEVKSQIDLNDYYDKEEVDDLLENKADKSEIPDISGLATKQELTSGLADKADKTDTYTKSEVNNLIPDVSELASKTELNDGLALKADKSDTYTKSEVDNLIPDISGLATKQELTTGLSGKVDNSTLNNYYTKTETNDLLSAKADKSTTYTKSEIDTLLNAKANTSDLPDMTNYYTKTETYSKTEIDNILGNIESILEAI